MYFTNCNIKTNSDLNPVYYNVLGTAQVPLGTVPRLIGVPRLTYLPVLGMAKNSAQVVMLNQGCAVYMGFYCTLIIFFRDFRVGFNSLCAFASVNHLHLHAFYSPHVLPVESAVSYL